MTVYAFIPARGGSTRIPDKNLALVGGVSLVCRAVRAALAADCVPVLSTDSPAVRRAVAELHADWFVPPVLHHTRPAELSGPEAQIEDAIAHWVDGCGVQDDDVIALLQPTSPFRRAETVRAVVEGARQYGASLTVTACPEVHFAGTMVMDVVHWRVPREVDRRPRSQDMQDRLREDGCVYAFTVEHWHGWRLRMNPSHARHVVEVSRWESLEIDDPDDLDAARALAPMMDGAR